MALFFVHTLFSQSTVTPFIIKPTKTPFFSMRIKATSIPARDRVIDFGKHKGKMLGTLPSTYLNWISNNLRAQDFEHWAKMADSVLQDPVYRDRVEWEFAERVLQGGETINASSIRNGGDASADAQLLEISERFSWDNEDRSGWRKIDFALLGTSRGGRIPRKAAAAHGVVSREVKREKVSRVLSEDELGRIERRRERRKRVVKSPSSTTSSRDVTVNENEVDDDENSGGGFNQKSDRTVDNHRSRFPGREGLLNKVLNHKRLM